MSLGYRLLLLLLLLLNVTDHVLYTVLHVSYCICVYRVKHVLRRL